MNYEEMRGSIRSGDLIVVSHQPWDNIDDIQSHIVRMATESEYSHVCVAVVNGQGEPFVLEAVVPCVTVSRVPKYLDHGFFWIPMPDKPMSKDEWDYGFSKKGEPYSKIEAIAAQLDLLKIGASRYWECAELTICMRKLSGVDFNCKATPAAVVRSALNMGYEIKFIKAKEQYGRN
jgi:hypothetical protein